MPNSTIARLPSGTEDRGMSLLLIQRAMRDHLLCGSAFIAVRVAAAMRLADWPSTITPTGPN